MQFVVEAKYIQLGTESLNRFIHINYTILPSISLSNKINWILPDTTIVNLILVNSPMILTITVLLIYILY